MKKWVSGLLLFALVWGTTATALAAGRDHLFDHEGSAFGMVTGRPNYVPRAVGGGGAGGAGIITAVAAGVAKTARFARDVAGTYTAVRLMYSVGQAIGQKVHEWWNNR